MVSRDFEWCVERIVVSMGQPKSIQRRLPVALQANRRAFFPSGVNAAWNSALSHPTFKNKSNLNGIGEGGLGGEGIDEKRLEKTAAPSGNDHTQR